MSLTVETIEEFTRLQDALGAYLDGGPGTVNQRYRALEEAWADWKAWKAGL